MESPHKYHIRFNTKHGGNTDIMWRVFEDGIEYLASDVRIFSPLFTETTKEYGETKWNVACLGRMVWDGTVAIITNHKD
jgi:hypothetical protein